MHKAKRHNYEKQLSDKPGFGLHFGVGLAGDKPSFPFGAKYLFQLGKQRSFLEIGAGVILMERYMENKLDKCQRG